MDSVEEICAQRFNAIQKLEKEFEEKPTGNTAIILRDLYKNWIKHGWSHSKAPSKEEIKDKITAYENYIKDIQEDFY